MPDKRILICITSQFGYHTDTYMYCKYLNHIKYEVHYAGFDTGLPRRELPNVQVHYIPVHANKLKLYILYLSSINKLIKKENFDVLFLVDCQASLLIRLCNIRRKSIMDVRTGDVKLIAGPISFYNLKIWFSTLFFKRITIISESLRQVLGLSSKKCHLLPLGGELLDLPAKKFDMISLFYIGTLKNRNIQHTVEGLSMYLKRNGLSIRVQYNIVGFGTHEQEKLLDCIEKNQLGHVVTFHGRKNHSEVFSLFEKSNIGVVYLPITKGYSCQPTTKLYEYLLSGMPVIATKTLENELSITQTDGVLIQDTPEAFALGLEMFVSRRDSYNSEMLKQKFNKYTWENIVKQNLEPYLDLIC